MKINKKQIITLLKILALPTITQSISITYLSIGGNFYTIFYLLLLVMSSVLSGIILKTFIDKEQEKRFVRFA